MFQVFGVRGLPKCSLLYSRLSSAAATSLISAPTNHSAAKFSNVSLKRVSPQNRARTLSSKTINVTQTATAMRDNGAVDTKPVHGHQTTSNKKQYCDRRLLKHSQDELFTMVSDINSYELFLPWCTKSTVISSHANGCTAKLEVGFASFKEQYTSEVSWRHPLEITAVAVDGTLFNELTNHWKFIPGPQQNGRPTTYVDINTTFEFKNALHALFAEAAFEKVTAQMIRAFEKRAAQMYGSR
eukprot:m.142436 g.142436  ORF g.142436 m.142436 type:complete len:241 (-) comp30250_c0_seq1:23-745(-)